MLIYIKKGSTAPQEGVKLQEIIRHFWYLQSEKV